MTLADVKIVDLKLSDVDWDNSDPDKGKYIFRKKVYYERATDSTGRKTFPKFVTDDEQGNIQDWKYSYGAQFVTSEDRDFWPEPLEPDTEHQFRQASDHVAPIEQPLGELEPWDR
jgi:hypothetical protein